MKKIILSILILLPLFLSAQYVNRDAYSIWMGQMSVGKVNVTTATPAGAWLEIGKDSTTKGVILPRVTSTAAITSPAKGMFAYSIIDSSLKYHTGNQWLTIAKNSDMGIQTENYLYYNIPFASPSFTDSTLVSQLAGSGTTNYYFNRGLWLDGTYTGSIENSRLVAWNYGHLINQNYSQKLVFQVGDSSSNLSIGIGTTDNQVLTSVLHQSGYITATLGNSGSTLTNSCVSQTTSTSGVVINAGDYVELQINQVSDSVVIYYRNITTGLSLSVKRKADLTTTTQYVSTVGYPAIYFAKGNVRLISYSISSEKFDYIVLGNSITAGYRVHVDTSYLDQLRTNTNALINNASRSGSTSSDYMKVKDNFNFYNKTVFISGLCGNDPFASISAATSKSNYITIVNRLRANGNRIVHIDNPFRTAFLGGGGWAQLNALNLWIDTTYRGIDSIVHVNGTLVSGDLVDGVHPNQTGHTKLANRILANAPYCFELQTAAVATTVDTIYYKPTARDTVGREYKVSWNNFSTPQVYPGAGIPNSTGSAWGTSYGVSGNGTTVALNNIPTIDSVTLTGLETVTGNMSFGSSNYLTFGSGGTGAGIKRGGSQIIQIVQDDGSTAGDLRMRNFETSGAYGSIGNNVILYANAGNGILRLADYSAGTEFSKLIFGSADATHPSFIISGDSIKVRNGSNTADAKFTAGMSYFTGNVGVGTTSPGAKLDLTSTGNNNLRIAYNGSFYWDIYRDNVDGSLQFKDVSSGTPRVTFLTGGSVGIGITSPASLLHIKSATPVLTVDNTSDISKISLTHNGTEYSSWQSSYGGGETRFANSSGGYLMTWWANGSESMRLTTNNQLVLGSATAAGAFTVANNGAASLPGIAGNGTWYSGGSATTNKPYLLIEPIGTTSNNWHPNGTGFGVNAASGFTGSLLEFQVAGVNKLTVSYSGTVSSQGAMVTGTSGFTTAQGGNGYNFSSGGFFTCPSNGIFKFSDNTDATFNRLQFGGTTSSYTAIARSGDTVKIRLADNSGDAKLTAGLSYFTGNVGIGTTSPTKPLHIKNSNPQIELEQTGGGVQKFITRIGNNTGSSNAQWNLLDSNSNKIRMAFSGETFIVGNTLTSYASSLIYGFGGGSGANFDAQPDSLVADYGNIEVMKSDYTNGEGVALRGYGNVGIAGTYSAGILNKNLGNLDFNNTWNLIRVSNNASLWFATNNVKRAVLDSNGRFGIGTALPTEALQVTGNVRFSGALMPNNSAGSSGNVLTSAGAGNPPTWSTSTIGATTNRVTAQTGAATLATYTVGASDQSFLVSANVLVTTATLHNFTATCTYTDESNTSRTLTLNFSTIAGAITPTIANAGGALPYEGVPLHIRCKAGSTIVLATTGTFTTVTYNFEEMITALN